MNRKKTKQNLETRTAEMEQWAFKAMVEISQIIDLFHWFYIVNASSIILPL